MSVERSGKNTLPDDKKSLLLILQVSAVFMIVLGSAGFIFPEAGKEFLGFDDLTFNIFCGVVIFIGIFEFFYFPKMFKRANKQAQNND